VVLSVALAVVVTQEWAYKPWDVVTTDVVMVDKDTHFQTFLILLHSLPFRG
jgi:hypothetical protein